MAHAFPMRRGKKLRLRPQSVLIKSQPLRALPRTCTNDDDLRFQVPLSYEPRRSGGKSFPLSQAQKRYSVSRRNPSL